MFECRHPSRRGADGQNDHVTLQDCEKCVYRPRPLAARGQQQKTLILRNYLCPGDVLVMTAAVRSLHMAYPGQYQVAVDTSCPELWDHSPDVIDLNEAHAQGGTLLPMHYPLVDQSNQRAVHFMQGYCEYLGMKLRVPVPLLVNRPQVFLSRQEREWLGQVQEITKKPIPFWVINAGHKQDYTAKWWGQTNFQRVVDLLRGKVQFVQVGASEHKHPPLENVLDLRGKTSQRQLVRLVWHARGVVTGVSFLHHLAAAMEKPCVTIAGGREPVAWNSYPKCHLLHTVGMLACCREGGCWRSRVVRQGDNTPADASLCEQPLFGGETIGRCMTLVRPEAVAEMIEKIATGC